MSEDAIPILHVWQQDCHHGEAFIFGNLAALKQLRDSIDLAIRAQAGDDTTSFFQNDGEGYSICIRSASEAWLNLLSSAYTDYANEATDPEREAFQAILTGRAG